MLLPAVRYRRMARRPIGRLKPFPETKRRAAGGFCGRAKGVFVMDGSYSERAPLATANGPKGAAWDTMRVEMNWLVHRQKHPTLDGVHDASFRAAAVHQFEAATAKAVDFTTVAAGLAVLSDDRPPLIGIGYFPREGSVARGLDFDNCRDPVTGEITDPNVREILSWAESYAEVSPSGRGIRIWFASSTEGEVDYHIERNGFGATGCEKRYYTFTGNHLPGSPREILPAPRSLARVLELAGATQFSRHTGNRQRITAPSLEILREAVNALPNDGDHFYDYEPYIGVCHAIKGAAVGTEFEEDARELLRDFCVRWEHSAGEPAAIAEADRVWESIHSPNNDFASLMAILADKVPDAAARIRDMVAKEEFAAVTSRFVLEPVHPFDPTRIPPRKWLYGRHVIGGHISMVVAPGGSGKTALLMAEALAMATGRELLIGDKPHHALKVWYHNAEDDLDDVRRLLAAAMAHHRISHDEIGDRLFLTSGRDLSLKLAGLARGTAELQRPAIDFLIDRVRSAGVDVLILDPLAALHTLPENANDAANVLMSGLREVCHATGVAIILSHHSSKQAALDMGAAGAAGSRGASAWTDAARSVRQIVKMKKEEATRLKVPADEHWRYCRIDNGKANLAPAQNARWVKLVSVDLGNATADWQADHVQAVEAWTPANIETSADDLTKALAAIEMADEADRRENKTSKRWVGRVVASALNIIDQQGWKATAADVLKELAARGQIEVYESKGGDRHSYDFVRAVAAPVDSWLDESVAEE